MKKIAIVGAGVVGATAAYYLAKEKDLAITVFDEGTGQASKAAAGIICPWFSKRRNKAWYRMARLGADFYQDLLADLEKQGQKTDFYQQKGVLLLKKDESKLAELYDLAKSRQQESPLIGDLQVLSAEQVEQQWPGLTGFDQLLYASGAARVDGGQLTESLLAASSAKVVKKKVSLEISDQGTYKIDSQSFDGLILACGAWLGQILSPLGYVVDIRPQKGQLRDYFLANFPSQDYPVLMPEGELDLIPFADGKISLGASHENDQGFDLSLDDAILDSMEQEAQTYFPDIKKALVSSARVGTRAYSSDFAPFFGQIAGLSNLYAASGLGSSGLTTGPLIGKQLADMLMGRPTLLNPDDYDIKNYIDKVDDDTLAKKC